jgi:hypothetical protein
MFTQKETGQSLHTGPAYHPFPSLFDRISEFSILQQRPFDADDHADAAPYRTSPDALAGEK